MKRVLYVSLIALAISVNTRAQEAEKAVAKIHYIFKHINDTTQRDKFLRDEVVTYLGPNSSYYTSNSSNRAQESLKKQMDDPAFDGNVKISRDFTTISEFYLIDKAKKDMQEVMTVGGDQLIIASAFPEQDWTIAEETKEIGGYSCQKATTSFKGRQYTAWFTTELPFSSGPWKLQGLPGLILEASDAKGDVTFAYAGFDKVEDGETAIQVSSNAVKSTKKEALKLLEAFKANPQAYMQSKAARSGGSINISGSGGTTVIATGSKSNGSPAKGALDMSRIKSFSVQNAESYKPSRDTNNPIELTP